MNIDMHYYYLFIICLASSISYFVGYKIGSIKMLSQKKLLLYISKYIENKFEDACKNCKGIKND